VAEAFYTEQLSLPLFVELSFDQQDRVVEQLRAILA
jgi:perosamine synthetase